jgi:hypothetical protein
MRLEQILRPRLATVLVVLWFLTSYQLLTLKLTAVATADFKKRVRLCPTKRQHPNSMFCQRLNLEAIDLGPEGSCAQGYKARS